MCSEPLDALHAFDVRFILYTPPPNQACIISFQSPLPPILLSRASHATSSYVPLADSSRKEQAVNPCPQHFPSFTEIL